MKEFKVNFNITGYECYESIFVEAEDAEEAVESAKTFIFEQIIMSNTGHIMPEYTDDGIIAVRSDNHEKTEEYYNFRVEIETE